MPKVIRDGRIVPDDWRHLDDAEPLPTAGKFIISLNRWRQEKATWRGGGAVGLRMPAEQGLEELIPDLHEFTLIALEFSVFRDGRCFSLARMLREQLGFRGELRAVGDVLRDQMFYMQRVGINAFEIRGDKCLQEALAGLSDFSAAYQPAADHLLPIWRRRQTP